MWVLLMALSVATGTFQIGTGTATTTVSVTSLSFQPKVVIFLWTGRTAVGQSETDHKFGMGYMVSSSDRGGSTSQSDHSPTAAATDSQVFDDACIKLLTIAGAIDGAADFDAFLSNGFRVVIDSQFDADYLIHYIAIGGDDLTNVASATLSITATGNLDVTTIGFQPDCALLFGGNDAAINTTTTFSAWIFGVVDTALTNYVLAGGSDDAAPTMVTYSYCKSGECYANPATDALDPRGAISAWLSNGFRFNCTEKGGGTPTCVARVLCLKGGQYVVGDVLTATNTTPFNETIAFAPTGMIFASHCKAQSTADTTQANDERSVGFVTGPSNRSCGAIMDKDASGNADVGVVAGTTEIYNNLSTATTIVPEGFMDLTAIGTTTTLVMDDADPAQAFVWYLAMGSNPGKAPPPYNRPYRPFRRPY